MENIQRILTYRGTLSKWMKWVIGGVNRWGPTLLVMVVIFLASSIPEEYMPSAGGGWDFPMKKTGHMLGYALLAASVVRGQQKHTPKAIVIALGVCLLFALSDEYHQSFVPGRNSTLIDVGIDSLGASSGMLLQALLRRRRSMALPKDQTFQPGR